MKEAIVSHINIPILRENPRLNIFEAGFVFCNVILKEICILKPKLNETLNKFYMTFLDAIASLD